jgi:hypothetical protein
VGGFWFRKSAKRVIGANSIALDVRNPKDCLVITWILLLRPRQRRLKAHAESGLVASSHDTQYPPLSVSNPSLLRRQQRIEVAAKGASLFGTLQPRCRSIGRLLVPVPAIFWKASSSPMTLPESSRLVTPKSGGFFNRRYGDFCTGADR